MKAGTNEITCLLGIERKCSVKTYVHVPVKGKKDDSPEPESVMKEGKGKRSCLLDEENRSVHAKAKVYSWGIEKSE